MRTALCVLVLCALALPAAAEEKKPLGYAAVSVGATIPRVFNPLGVAPMPQLRAGVFLPALDGRLAAGIALGYAQPSVEKTVNDPRVPGGAYTYTLTERTLRLGLGAQLHFAPATDELSPYAGARFRLHFVEGTMAGRAGSAFGDVVEQGTQAGGAVFGGVLYRLGPGRLLAELELDLAPIDHLITGDRNLSALALDVGYGLVF